MKNYNSIGIWKLIFAFSLSTLNLVGQKTDIGKIEGIVQLDSSWEHRIYLSYIPTFEDIHSMSNEMIIAESKINNLGYFNFELDFLPKTQNLYRLHISKRKDAKTSLIIGGLNENHLVFLADSKSKIKLEANCINPPFKNTAFLPKSENAAFQKITDMVNTKDSISANSGLAKRKFIEEKLVEDLLNIADISTNELVSLYAIYKSDFISNYVSNKKFYSAYLKKWSNADSKYFDEFRKKLPIKEDSNNYGLGIIISIALIFMGYLLGKYGFQKNNRLKKLSVQERKVFDLLKKGATNKEIADEFNIGLSTSKSHVSSILNKLKIKSRKEIMDFK